MLRCAVLCCAVLWLHCAVLFFSYCAVLCCAVLCRAVLAQSAERRAVFNALRWQLSTMWPPLRCRAPYCVFSTTTVTKSLAC